MLGPRAELEDYKMHKSFPYPVQDIYMACNYGRNVGNNRQSHVMSRRQAASKSGAPSLS